MSNDLTAHPGDLITADLWNKVLELIDGVDARITANEARVVPAVVGDFLGTARDEIDRSQLGLATVLDIEGTRVTDPTDPMYTNRIVLAQMPSPEDRVRIGRTMSLLITAAPGTPGAGAPVIQQVKATEGGDARVGKPLEITGTNFKDPAVLIRNTPVDASLLTVSSETLIKISAVPRFDEAPGPGESKSVAVTVTTAKGSDWKSVTFSEPKSQAARPFIRNVRVCDAKSLRVMGTALSQNGQDTDVTIDGSAVGWSAVSDNELQVGLPEKLAVVLGRIAGIQRELFEMLLEIDQRDLFLLDLPITVKGVSEVGGRKLGTIARGAARSLTAERSELLRGTLVSGLALEAFGRTRPVKLFVAWSLKDAEAILTADNKKLFSTSTATAGQVTVTLGLRRTLTIDLEKLAAISIAVGVGNQKASFPLLVGEA